MILGIKSVPGHEFYQIPLHPRWVCRDEIDKLTNRHARKLQDGRKKRGGEVKRRFKSRTFSRSLGKELVLSSEGIGDKRSIGEETQTGGGEL